MPDQDTARHGITRVRSAELARPGLTQCDRRTVSLQYWFSAVQISVFSLRFWLAGVPDVVR